MFVRVYLLGPSNRNYNLYFLNSTEGIINSSTGSGSNEKLRGYALPGEYLVLVNRSGRGGDNYTLIVSGVEVCEEDGECGSGENCLSCDDCSCRWDRCCTPSSGSADSMGCIPRGVHAGEYICCDFGSDSLLVPEELCLEVQSCSGTSLEKAINITIPYTGKTCSREGMFYYRFNILDQSVVYVEAPSNRIIGLEPLEGSTYLLGPGTYLLEVNVSGDFTIRVDSYSAPECSESLQAPCIIRDGSALEYKISVYERSIPKVDMEFRFSDISYSSPSSVLEPGTYSFSIQDFADGRPAEITSFSVSFLLRPTCGGPSIQGAQELVGSIEGCYPSDGGEYYFYFMVESYSSVNITADSEGILLTVMDENGKELHFPAELPPGRYYLAVKDIPDGSEPEFDILVSVEGREGTDYITLSITLFIILGMAYMLYFKNKL